MQVFSIVLALLVAVLPPVSPKRPKTSRLSRGAVWTSFEALRIDQKELDKAKREAAKLPRVAVAAGGELATDASSVCAFLLGQKLSYDQHVLSVDFVSTKQLFQTCKSLDQAIEVAQENRIAKLVWCSQLDQNITITLATVGATVERQVVVTIAAGEAWLGGLPDVRSKVYAALGASISEQHRIQLPSLSATALSKYVEAYSTAAQIINADNEEAQQALCKQAVELADQALLLDPGLIEAYLLKASCLDELGDTGAVKQTLRDGYSRRDPQSIDALTNFELEADYARFFKNDLDAAFSGYLQILESDPHNLRGAWGLIDILLTGDGLAKPGKEDLAEAAKLATNLMAAHPHAAVASVIANQLQK